MDNGGNVPSYGGGGNPFDQELNTSDSPTFQSVNAATLIAGTTGSAALTARRATDSDINQLVFFTNAPSSPETDIVWRLEEKAGQTDLQLRVANGGGGTFVPAVFNDAGEAKFLKLQLASGMPLYSVPYSNAVNGFFQASEGIDPGEDAPEFYDGSALTLQASGVPYWRKTVCGQNLEDVTVPGTTVTSVIISNLFGWDLFRPGYFRSRGSWTATLTGTYVTAATINSFPVVRMELYNNNEDYVLIGRAYVHFLGTDPTTWTWNAVFSGTHFYDAQDHMHRFAASAISYSQSELHIFPPEGAPDPIHNGAQRYNYTDSDIPVEDEFQLRFRYLGSEPANALNSFTLTGLHYSFSQ